MQGRGTHRRVGERRAGREGTDPVTPGHPFRKRLTVEGNEATAGVQLKGRQRREFLNVNLLKTDEKDVTGQEKDCVHEREAA